MDRIVLVTRQTGESRELPPTFDEQPVLLGWSADSTRVLFAEYRDLTRVSLQHAARWSAAARL
jgi:hypothetical protein